MVQPKIDKEIQISMYKKYRKQIFDEYQKLRPCSDKIYEVLKKELDGKLDGMSGKAIQTSIARNLSKIVGDDSSVKENEVSVKEYSVLVLFNKKCVVLII